jgi:hypothetical protein
VRPLLLALALAAVGCSAPQASPSPSSGDAGDDASDAGAPPCGFLCGDGSFATDASPAEQVRGVIDQICSNADGCHGQGAGGMSLSVGNEFASLIGVRSTERPDLLRVSPGDPLGSYVFLKLRCDGGVVQDCMPQGSPDPTLAPIFAAWIEAGAPLP